MERAAGRLLTGLRVNLCSFTFGRVKSIGRYSGGYARQAGEFGGAGGECRSGARKAETVPRPAVSATQRRARTRQPANYTAYAKPGRADPAIGRPYRGERRKAAAADADPRLRATVRLQWKSPYWARRRSRIHPHRDAAARRRRR